jgi:hypothetical protein
MKIIYGGKEVHLPAEADDFLSWLKAMALKCNGNISICVNNITFESSLCNDIIVEMWNSTVKEDKAFGNVSNEDINHILYDIWDRCETPIKILVQ